MILLVTHGLPTIIRHRTPNLGRLLQPRHYNRAKETALGGITWAADNDCFQGLDTDAYLRMLDALAGLPACRFCVVPDVVADHHATLELWHQWAPIVRDAGLPPAFVLQDGIPGPDAIPPDAAAVFIGGSTAFKLGEDAHACVDAAKARGLWVHMGRVNSEGRIAYAASIGCDSIDGSGWSKFVDTYLARGLRAAAAPPQLRLDSTDGFVA